MIYFYVALFAALEIFAVLALRWRHGAQWQKIFNEYATLQGFFVLMFGVYFVLLR